MRLGDHGRTVIIAVPPTAHAMSGIHQQHDPVDVKSLGDAIHFAAHRCARAESVRGDGKPYSASDWHRTPRPNAWTLMPRSTSGAALACGLQGSARAVGSLGFGPKSWRLQRADAWPRWLLRGIGPVW